MATKASDPPALDLVLKRNSVERLNRDKSRLGMLDELPALIGQRACVVEVGAGLRTYSVDGWPVIDGYDAGDLCRSGRGQVLAPWPNRIAGVLTHSMAGATSLVG
jgi:hypothetical protein